MSSLQEIEQILRSNLEERGLEVEEVEMRRGERSEAREIEIVSDDFQGLSHDERMAEVRPALEDWIVSSLELLTSNETDWARRLSETTSRDELPLWPEALERGEHLDEMSPDDFVFPSDLDSDIEPPVRATFYSLRGGVGRSTALAYAGRLLAERDLKVVCIDMDLEAPGLASLFGVESKARDTTGVVELLLEYEYGREPDLANSLIPVMETNDLYCIPAGVANLAHARRLQFIEPDQWYRTDKNPLRLFERGLRDDLPFTPDVALFDARTGMNTLNAPLLFELSDLAIVTFLPESQAKHGTEALVRALLTSTSSRTVDERELSIEPRFVGSPIPATKELFKTYEHRGLEWISNWLSPIKSEENEADWVESELSHFVEYRENIASADSIELNPAPAWELYGPVADWIDGLVPEEDQNNLEGEKNEILQDIEFSTGIAENLDSLRDIFVKTDIVEKAISSDTPLVRGRKGAGKTALFRWLLEQDDAEHVAVTAPNGLRTRPLLSRDGFKIIEKHIRASNTGWREFWLFYIAVIVCLELKSEYRVEGLPVPSNPAMASYIKKKDITREKQIVTLFENYRRDDQFGLDMRSWLQALDETVLELHQRGEIEEDERFLLFDGLDTGFGRESRDRERRNKALEGLFGCVDDVGASLEYFRFKVFLREDIWKRLTFENKSHFLGRSIAFIWENQSEFLKVVVKQALNADSFWRLVSDEVTGEREALDRWGREDVFRAWRALVGERMRGAKTTYTKNWVWQRLADANDKHSPRYALELFRRAVDWEIDEQKNEEFYRTVIRPRGLTEVLPEVSEQAVNALREEFAELKEFMQTIEAQEKTIVPAEEFDECESDDIRMARDIGLLEIYEESEDTVERYRVPELYRYGLGLKRKGPA